ncbi:MAG: RING finger protein [Pirellulaceae bacterium]|nr:RING finger protein [Pirellulaceae bacterium]MDP6722366.1 RING finger protein [Pirellulaceae bacterium]
MAEELGTFLIFIGIGVALFFLFLHTAKQARELDDTYQRVARSLGGHSVPGGVMGRPTLRFSYAGGQAVVDIYSTGGKHAKYYTQLHLGWPDAHLRCEVCPQRVISVVGKFLGMQDIQIGSPEFDPLYLISGNSEEAIRRLLSKEVQLAIGELRRFLGNDDICISICGGLLLIKKRTLIRDDYSLKRFVRLGIKLHDAASGTNAEGIDFVNAGQRDAVLSLASAICQICGDDITIDAVFCRNCKTPHHRDCWQYYGSCSTYGCGQTKFLVAKKHGGSGKRVAKRAR